MFRGRLLFTTTLEANDNMVTEHSFRNFALTETEHETTEEMGAAGMFCLAVKLYAFETSNMHSKYRGWAVNLEKVPTADPVG